MVGFGGLEASFEAVLVSAPTLTLKEPSLPKLAAERGKSKGGKDSHACKMWKLPCVEVAYQDVRRRRGMGETLAML